jgi:hypothetical protein
MGSGSKTSHVPYSVSPAEPVGAPIAAVQASDAPAVTAAGEAYAEAVAQLGEVHDYQGLSEATAAVLEAKSALVGEGWPPQLAAEAEKGLKVETSNYLGNLSIEELQELAAAQGFEHPTLVGWNTTPGGQHPLAHWLDPVYPPESPSKLAIQAKAAERYAQLAAGETINGLTWADVAAQESNLGGGHPPGSWQATPADVVGAMTSFNQVLATSVPFNGQGEWVANLVGAENHFAAVVCPGMPAGDLEAAKAAAKANVDKVLATAGWKGRDEAAAKLMAEASAAGTIDSGSAQFLTPGDQIMLARLSTPASERQGLQALASKRVDQVATLKELHQAHAANGLAGMDPKTATAAQVSEWAKGSGAYFASAKDVAQWASSSAASAELLPIAGHAHTAEVKASQLTTEFRSWAKGQSLDELRGTAKALGMDPQGASRAQVQNWIAASWDSNLSKPEIQGSIAAKLQALAQPKSAVTPAPGHTPKTVTPGTAPLSSGSSVSTVRPGVGSFAAKHQDIVATLKAHQAVMADLPPRPSQSDVQAWAFGPGQSAALGGAHQKTLHAAPDGSMWLFKPDSSGGGRAEAEAAVSQIYQRAGVPGVGVYVRQMGGTVGCIQPLVSGASTLSGNPKTWSQSDVDAMVRMHVAAWGVGDHDANHTNVIRTPSGGLLPVDGGQAFKHFGTDKLDLGYHPNGAYGTGPPVFHQAYKAGLGGGFAPGVRIRPEAALPTIKAFEAIPESQYRSIVAGVATKGVASGVAWVPTMRKAAQKRLGKQSVSSAEIADEFVRYAVERKQGLRKAFAGFFAGLGFDGASKLEKVA